MNPAAQPATPPMMVISGVLLVPMVLSGCIIMLVSTLLEERLHSLQCRAGLPSI
jgi:hypothetical protein